MRRPSGRAIFNSFFIRSTLLLVFVLLCLRARDTIDDDLCLLAPNRNRFCKDETSVCGVKRGEFLSARRNFRRLRVIWRE